MKTVLALVALAGAASASLADFEQAQLHSHIYIDALTGVQYDSPRDNEFVGTVHDNTTTAPISGISSTNLANIWGDDWVGAGTGTVDSVSFSVFNSSSSANVLATATVAVRFWDNTDATGATLLGLQGGFNGNVDFSGGVIGGGLGKGFYSIVTFTGLSSLGINLLDTYNIVTQQVTALTGGATRLGVVLLSAPTVGTGFTDFYQSPGSAGAGFYNLAGGATPAYIANKTTVIPAPGALAMLGLGGLVAGRRRR